MCFTLKCGLSTQSVQQYIASLDLVGTGHSQLELLVLFLHKARGVLVFLFVVCFCLLAFLMSGEALVN